MVTRYKALTRPLHGAGLNTKWMTLPTGTDMASVHAVLEIAK